MFFKGPGTITEENYDILVGVIDGLNGGSCGNPKFYTVYESVYAHKDWIENTINEAT